MIALEAHFLDLILELAAMRQPVTATDALALINSMISTSDLSASVIEWKKKHLPGSFDDDRAALLGKKYWQNFKKRHPEIKQKRQYILMQIERTGATLTTSSTCMTMYILPWLPVK